jgi:hypothetical protein
LRIRRPAPAPVVRIGQAVQALEAPVIDMTQGRRRRPWGTCATGGTIRGMRAPGPAGHAALAFACPQAQRSIRAHCSFCLRLSGKDSAVWISPTATLSWPQPSRSAVAPRAETAGSLQISTAATRQGGITRQPRLRAAAVGRRTPRSPYERAEAGPDELMSLGPRREAFSEPVHDQRGAGVRCRR